MRIAYLRISTEEQRPDRQIDALQSVCDELHIETLSALARKRPVYKSVMAKLKPGDTLVIWEISRAWRSVLDAIREGEKLKQRGVHLQIGTMPFDLAIPEMEFTFIVMAATAQLELTRLKVRTKEGMKAARKSGKHIGRLKNDTLRSAHAAIAAGQETPSGMAEKLGCSEDALAKGFRRLGLDF